MRVEIVKTFLLPQECEMLNDWANAGINAGWLDKGHEINGATNKRLTSRAYGYRFTTPSEILKISDKIRRFVGVDSYPLVVDHGKDGIVVSCTFSGGDVFSHADPRSIPHLATLRCNVMTQKPEVGGILHIDGKPVPLDAGDLHCYLASEHQHYVTTVYGDIARVCWMFGACVPKEDWNSNHIKIGDAHEVP